MEAAFKKQIIKQLDKCVKELETLLTIEGSLSDVHALPLGLGEQAKRDIAFFNQCKKDIENGRPPRPHLSSRLSYARPLEGME